MLHVANRIDTFTRATQLRLQSRRGAEEGIADLLLRAQCNRRLLARHFRWSLRSAPAHQSFGAGLIRAESIADQQTPGRPRAACGNARLRRRRRKRIASFTSTEYQGLVKPSDGATLAALDFRPTGSTLINSILRRQEAYHARLREIANNPSGAVTSIHEQTRVKEPGLERFLRYDRWPRHTFRLLLFDSSRSHADYENIQLQEDSGFAGGEFRISRSTEREVELVREAPLAWHGKGDSGPRLSISEICFPYGPAPRGCEVACEVKIALPAVLDRTPAVGIESVLNFLAPTEPDRFFQTPSGPQNLRFSGSIPAPRCARRRRLATHSRGATRSRRRTILGFAN